MSEQPALYTTEEVETRSEVVFEDPVQGLPYAEVEMAVLASPTLSLGARTLYALLRGFGRRKGYCFPGQRRLSQNLGVSDRQCRTYLDELKEVGLVKIVRRGFHLTNWYVLPRLTLVMLEKLEQPDDEWKPTSDQDRK